MLRRAETRRMEAHRRASGAVANSPAGQLLTKVSVSLGTLSKKPTLPARRDQCHMKQSEISSEQLISKTRGSNIGALVSTLGCAKSVSSAWWARANLEFCRCWRYATGGDWGVSLIQERALKRCVGEFTRNSLIEGLQDIKKTASSAFAARIKGYGLMLSYYAERAALMTANLVDTEEDVALLREAGVVVRHLGSDAAVAKMWNELALGLPFYPSAEWATLLFNVNNRTKDWKKQYWVEFREIYFSRPWYASALVVAASLLLLSIAQTVLAALQLVPHPH